MRAPYIEFALYLLLAGALYGIMLHSMGLL